MTDLDPIPDDGDWHEVGGVLTSDEVMQPEAYEVLITSVVAEEGVDKQVILAIVVPGLPNPLYFAMPLETACVLGNDLWETQEHLLLGTRHSHQAVRPSLWQRVLDRARNMPRPLQQRGGYQEVD